MNEASVVCVVCGARHWAGAPAVILALDAAPARCNMAYATATWGIVTRFEVVRSHLSLRPPFPFTANLIPDTSCDCAAPAELIALPSLAHSLARSQILVTVVLAICVVSCVVCLNGTEVVPGVWAKDKEIWATAWSHENPNLRRKLIPEVQGDGYDPRRPEVKPRMFRSWQQQSQL